MGVKEKKAIEAIEKDLTTGVGQKLKTTLGNDGLELVLAAEDGLDASKIELAGKGIAAELIPMIIEVCSDADYKDEVAKFKKISFKIQPEVTKPKDFYVYCNFNANGDSLEAVVDTSHTPSNGTPQALKDYFESLF